MSDTPSPAESAGQEGDSIDLLLEQIDAHRRVIDRRLLRPSVWRGPIRREFERSCLFPPERARVAAAFNQLAAMAADGPQAPRLDGAFLRTLHALVTGGDGDYRTREVRVAHFLNTAHWRDVPLLVEISLQRAADNIEPPALAAARLHMELLLIRPFLDGNGRTVRLASSWLLLRAGYRSTLFTAVEQHSRIDPRGYVEAFNQSRGTGPNEHDLWLVTALGMMARSTQWAASFRLRELSLRRWLYEEGVPRASHDRVLLNFDLDRSDPHPAASRLALIETPWVKKVAALSPTDLEAVRCQVNRLLAEEATDASSRRADSTEFDNHDELEFSFHDLRIGGHLSTDPPSRPHAP